MFQFSNDNQQLTDHVKVEDGTICSVCPRDATGYHYGAISCEGCKSFFRRSIIFAVSLEKSCPYMDHPINPYPHCTKNCTPDKENKLCQRCRLDECFKVGMKYQPKINEILHKALLSSEPTSLVQVQIHTFMVYNDRFSEFAYNIRNVMKNSAETLRNIRDDKGSKRALSTYFKLRGMARPFVIEMLSKIGVLRDHYENFSPTDDLKSSSNCLLIFVWVLLNISFNDPLPFANCSMENYSAIHKELNKLKQILLSKYSEQQICSVFRSARASPEETSLRTFALSELASDAVGLKLAKNETTNRKVKLLIILMDRHSYMPLIMASALAESNHKLLDCFMLYVDQMFISQFMFLDDRNSGPGFDFTKNEQERVFKTEHYSNFRGTVSQIVSVSSSLNRLFPL